MFSSVQSLSHVWLFATQWAVPHQTSLSVTNSWSLLKPMSIEMVMPSNHLILCLPLLLPLSIFPSIRVFSNEWVLHIRWQKYWSFSFSISPSNEYSGLISFRIDWLTLLAVLILLPIKLKLQLSCCAKKFLTSVPSIVLSSSVQPRNTSLSVLHFLFSLWFHHWYSGHSSD